MKVPPGVAVNCTGTHFRQQAVRRGYLRRLPLPHAPKRALIQLLERARWRTSPVLPGQRDAVIHVDGRRPAVREFES